MWRLERRIVLDFKDRETHESSSAAVFSFSHDLERKKL
jgi:hypothetical protein